ncbi:MAG TPA: PAS domain S-box protein, partial [Burkholderiales bacterium]|nr:PAS domain S-box protein [Burkholderiales bacterium]
MSKDNRKQGKRTRRKTASVRRAHALPWGRNVDLLGLAADWTWEQDEHFRFTRYSGSFEEKTGLHKKSLIGKCPWEMSWTSISDEEWERHKTQLYRHEPFYDFEMCRLDDDGEQRWTSVSGAPIFGKNGRFKGYRGIGRDITAKKLAEKSTRAAAERFRDLIELSTGWYWEQDENFRFVWNVDERFDKSGFSLDNDIGKTRWELPYIGVSEEQWAEHRAVLAAHQPFKDLELCRLATEGTLRWCSISGRPVYDATGRFIGYRGTGRDITQRRHREEVLGQFRVAIDATADGIHIIDRETMRFIDVNKTACVYLGYTRDEFLKLAIPDIAPGADMAKLRKLYDRLFSGEDKEQSAEITHVHKNGTAIPIEIRRSGTVVNGRRIVVNVVRNITQRKKEEAALREREERFRLLTELSSDWYWEMDADLCFTDVRGGNAGKSKFRSPSHNGKKRWELPYVDVPEETWEKHKADLYARRPFYDLVLKRRLNDGSIGVVSISGIPIYDESGVFTGYRGVGKDITESVNAEAVLRESEARFRDLTELSSDWFWEMGADLRFSRISGGEAFDKAQYTSPAHLGKFRWELPYIDVPEDLWEKHKADLEARRPFHDMILKRRLDDGSIGVVSISGKPMFDKSGTFIGYRGVGKDITQATKAQERIQYLATHDNLTGLPNRAMFSELLNLGIEMGRRYKRQFALLFIDLDRFKNINDTFGHEAGDLLLKEMSRRLVSTLRASDVVARLGGDEFVVLVQEVTEEQQVARIARKVLATLIRPMVLLGQECRVTASIGISVYPKDAEDEQALMKNADIAMYRAKEEGKNNFQFYSEQLNVHTLERMALETSLRRALERDELSLHYQAKQDLKSGRIAGVEALLRWYHPDLGMVAPAQFIPLAEETGLIIPIGKWVLRTACMQNIAWQRQGLPPLCMAVNLSPRQFVDDDLVNDIAAVLKTTGLKPELLELELTESMVMHNPERAVKLLTGIKEMGVRIAIDDFGVGYSSL